MTYRNYFLLDLRSLDSPQKLQKLSMVENVCFLLYDAELPPEAVPILKNKCRRVRCFLPISAGLRLSEFWKGVRNL